MCVYIYGVTFLWNALVRGTGIVWYVWSSSKSGMNVFFSVYLHRGTLLFGCFHLFNYFLCVCVYFGLNSLLFMYLYAFCLLGPGMSWSQMPCLNTLLACQWRRILGKRAERSPAHCEGGSERHTVELSSSALVIPPVPECRQKPNLAWQALAGLPAFALPNCSEYQLLFFDRPKNPPTLMTHTKTTESAHIPTK